MGLENYAYEEDSRLGSVFNSSKVDSEYDIRKIQESSLDHNGFVTKPENTYNALVEKGNHYEALKVTQASYKSRFQNDSVALSSKKINSMYETSEITPKAKYRTKRIKGYSSAVEDSSKCTYLVFSVLVAIIAITAAVMVFMILFGVISVRKCKECDLFEPKSEKQIQGNTNENVKLKLHQLLEDWNSTSIKMDDLYSKVTEDKNLIRNLTSQLNEQKELINNLRSQLNEQKEQAKKNDEIANLTREEVQNSTKKFESVIDTFTAIVNQSETKMSRNFENKIRLIDSRLNQVSSNISSIINDVYSLKDELNQTSRTILNITLREGPRGYNGSDGPEGKSANFTSCKFKTKSSGGDKKTSLESQNIDTADGTIIGAFCTSVPFSQIVVKIDENKLPRCTCNYQAEIEKVKCDIHYWYCEH